MATDIKQQEESVPTPIAVSRTLQLYLQEVFNRTELERRSALNRVRSDLNVPDDMAYNPERGVFMVPPAVLGVTGPEIVPDASD